MSLEGQTTKLTPVQAAEAKLSPTGRLLPPWQPGCIRSKVLARPSEVVPIRRAGLDAPK